MFKIITSIFLLLCLSLNAFAEDDGRMDGVFDIRNERIDDSCVPRYSFDRVINILTTLGIYYWFSNDFRMIHPQAETKESCQRPVRDGEGVKYVYIPSFFGLFDVGPTYKPGSGGLKHGEYITHGIVSLRGQNIGDMLCVQWLMTLGYRTIGCKYRQMPDFKATTSQKCYVDDQMCSKRIIDQSQSFIPITAPLVECVRLSVKTFFLGDGTDNCVTLLNRFQSNLRNIVMLLLTMYVIFFGIRLALVREISKGEAFMFLMKMLLVIYFSVGFKVGNTYSHGVEDVFMFFLSAATELSQIAVTSGNDSGLCMYPISSYGNAKHLLAWDYLDCRMGYYLGINTVARTGANILGSIASLLALIFNPIFLIISLLVLLFALFFIGIIVHVVHSFLISIIIITIVTFMAPIFVPMALFNQTKKMFDGWLQTLIGNTVQPIILMAFLSFMFAIMDDIIFPVPGCKWSVDTGQTTSMTNFMNTMFGTSEGRNWTMWKLEVDNSTTAEQQANCKNSFGYLMQCIGTFGQGGCPTDFWQALSNSTDSILQCLLFMFLFFFFVGMVDSIAADIAGVPSMGGAVGAMDMFNKVGGMVGGIVGNQASKIVDKVRQKKGNKEGNKKEGSDRKGGESTQRSTSVKN